MTPDERELLNSLHVVVSILLSVLTDEQVAGLNDRAKRELVRLPIPGLVR